MAERRRKFWGWGYEDEGPDREQTERIGQVIQARFGTAPLEITAPPTLHEIALREPRPRPPASLAGFCSTSPYDRASHAYGKSFRDVVRAFRRQYPNPPDAVAFPRTEEEIVSVLDWCASARLSAIPYG
ncbi:MAG: FAD-binding oxidoreductase, partial [Candidatus Binatia bacterium]